MINPMNNVSFTLIHGEDNIDEKGNFMVLKIFYVMTPQKLRKIQIYLIPEE